MAHYSSQIFYDEDEIKTSLKGISMRPLVSAFFAQMRVDAEDENFGRSIMAYVDHPNFRGDLFLSLTYTDNY